MIIYRKSPFAYCSFSRIYDTIKPGATPLGNPLKEAAQPLGKRNFIVIGVLLALALALFFAARPGGDEAVSGRVIVTQDGRFYAEGHLGQAEDIVVHGPDGEVNVISFTANGFFMSHSSCENQLCVKEGKVTADNFGKRALGTQIICLPNRVIAELELEGAPPDDMPDV